MAPGHGASTGGSVAADAGQQGGPFSDVPAGTGCSRQPVARLLGVAAPAFGDEPQQPAVGAAAEAVVGELFEVQAGRGITPLVFVIVGDQAAVHELVTLPAADSDVLGAELHQQIPAELLLLRKWEHSGLKGAESLFIIGSERHWPRSSEIREIHLNPQFRHRWHRCSPRRVFCNHRQGACSPRGISGSSGTGTLWYCTRCHLGSGIPHFGHSVYSS